MEKTAKLVLVAVAAAAAIGVGGAFTVATDDDQPLQGTDYDRATTAALEYVGEGAITETEIGDDGAAYEVEIRLDDGSQVEVRLDGDFDVIGSDKDDDGRAGDDD